MAFLFVEATMRGCLVINPVFLRVSHSMTAGYFTYMSGLAERARPRAVAECLGPVAPLTSIPVINDHLDCHLASIHPIRAVFFVRPCRKLPMTAFAVNRERRWNLAPGRRLCLFLNLPHTDFWIAELVEFDGLKERDGNGQLITGYLVTGPEIVRGVSAFSHAGEKFSGFTSDTTVHSERVTQICAKALVEGQGALSECPNEACRKPFDDSLGFQVTDVKCRYCGERLRFPQEKPMEPMMQVKETKSTVRRAEETEGHRPVAATVYMD
jgi:hypothetical protein